jgi:hypothetical protein
MRTSIVYKVVSPSVSIKDRTIAGLMGKYSTTLTTCYMGPSKLK